jgi:hypothetical protein
VSGFEQKTKKDLKAVGEAGLSRVPIVGYIYIGGKLVLDTTKDYKSKETVKSAIGIVTPLLLNKIGVPKPVSKNLVDGVLLGDKLNGK